MTQKHLTLLIDRAKQAFDEAEALRQREMAETLAELRQKRLQALRLWLIQSGVGEVADALTETDIPLQVTETVSLMPYITGYGDRRFVVMAQTKCPTCGEVVEAECENLAKLWFYVTQPGNILCSAFHRCWRGCGSQPEPVTDTVEADTSGIESALRCIVSELREVVLAINDVADSIRQLHLPHAMRNT